MARDTGGVRPVRRRRYHREGPGGRSAQL